MLDDVNVIKTCYEYFKSIPNMDDFGSIPMPKTAYQEIIKEASVCPIEMWVKDFAKKNYGSKEVTVSSAAQYTLFTDWCKKCGINYEVNNVQFGVRLARLNIDGVGESKHTKHGYCRVFDVAKLISHFKIESCDDDESDIDEIL